MIRLVFAHREERRSERWHAAEHSGSATSDSDDRRSQSADRGRLRRGDRDSSQSLSGSEQGVRAQLAHQPGEITGTSGAAREAAEDELAAMLSRGRVRGRGAVGSRADEPGPYLPVPDAGATISLSLRM